MAVDSKRGRTMDTHPSTISIPISSPPWCLTPAHTEKDADITAIFHAAGLGPAVKSSREFCGKKALTTAKQWRRKTRKTPDHRHPARLPLPSRCSYLRDPRYCSSLNVRPPPLLRDLLDIMYRQGPAREDTLRTQWSELRQNIPEEVPQNETITTRIFELKRNENEKADRNGQIKERGQRTVGVARGNTNVK
jgi:hypothetical protein